MTELPVDAFKKNAKEKKEKLKNEMVKWNNFREPLKFWKERMGKRNEGDRSCLMSMKLFL